MSANDVYTKLRTAPAYHPASVDLFDDCTLQAGDVVTVRSGNDSYALPIFSQHLVWNGASTMQLESTGNEKRSDLPALRKKDLNTSYGLGAGGYGTQKKNEEKFKKYETHFEQTDMYFSLLATESEWDELAQEGHVTAYTQILQTARDVSIVAAKTGIDGLAEGETLYSKINVNAEAISTEVARAQGQEASLSSRITQTAESISTEVTNRTNADNALSSRITQTATDISTLVTKTGVNGLGQNETLYSKINQNAESISTEVTNRTNADNALSSRITQNANSISLVVSNGNIDAASIVAAVNSAGSTVKITASHIILDGDAVANSLASHRLECGAFKAEGQMHCLRNFYCEDYISTDESVYAKNFYIGQQGLSAAIVGIGTATSSGGNITIPTTTAGGSAGPNINFNIAATQYYIDGVAAAETTGWDAARAKVAAPSQGTDTSFIVKVPSAVQNQQQQYTFTIQKGATPAATGYASVALNNIVVGRIAIGDWYTAGVSDGEGKFSLASVTLQGSQHANITPIGPTYHYTYSLLYKAGSANTYYKAGSSHTYYQGNGGYVVGRGTSTSVTPIGNAVKFKRHTKDETPTGTWYTISTGSAAYDLTYYTAGTAASYYNGNGSSGYLRGDSVSVTTQGDSVSVTEQGDSQWAYVANSEGSIVRYGAGTVISGLYNAGSTVTDTYYTKAAS